jgi:uncharacterized protein (TIGR02001 family)
MKPKSICRLFVASLLAGCGLVATSAQADETDPPGAFSVSGSITVVSQYRFRGLAQSDNKPAVQGAVTVNHRSGFYAGAWASSAQAGDGPIDIGGSEVDLFGGYSHTFNSSGLTVDLGAYGYLYPNASAGNYYELYGSLAKSLGPATAKVGVYVAPDQKVFDYNWTSAKRSNVYVYGELGSDIPGTPLNLHGHLGHTAGGFAWAKDYLDYSIGTSAKWKLLTLDLSLVGTNISKSDIDRGFGCAGGAACIDYYHRMSKTTVVASLTASF